MAHNIMRVDSSNDRYVTETMIDLNLDLNEDIDFDFFDNVKTPTKELLTKEHDTVSNSLSRPCSAQHVEDDDDVQVNPHLLVHDQSVSKVLSTTAASKDIHLSSDSIDEPLSTGTENDEKYSDNFDEYYSSVTGNTNGSTSDNAPVKEVSMPFDCMSQASVMNKSSECFLQSEKLYCAHSLGSKQNECRENDVPFKSGCDGPLISEFDEDDKDASNKSSHASIKSSENPNEDASRKSSLNQDGASIKSSESHNEDASSKSSESDKAEGSGSGYDSDEGCAEGSDSDELLLGVHTLTIIPRENESVSHRSMICDQTDVEENKMIHSTSCEKAAITARSSSGYSSASCKAHGCLISRGNTSKGEGRQSSQMKVCTPDMDEFIKSFRKVHPSPVSFASLDKHSTKKRKRRNMSFTNDELQRIERENAILLNKIVLQQRARPTVVHKYERRVTSNAINRAQQLKKIEYANEILLRKIQDVKRKSTVSAQNSRCISQASTSHL